MTYVLRVACILPYSLFSRPLSKFALALFLYSSALVRYARVDVRVQHILVAVNRRRADWTDDFIAASSQTSDRSRVLVFLAHHVLQFGMALFPSAPNALYRLLALVKGVGRVASASRRE